MTTEAPVRDYPLPLKERDLTKELNDILLFGEENSITGATLKKELGLTDTRAARLAMVEMRHHDIAVIGGSKGYFIAKDVNEIEEAREKLLSYIKSLCIDLRDLKRIGKQYAGQLRLKL